MADEFDANTWAALQKLGYDIRESHWANLMVVGFHTDLRWAGPRSAFSNLAKQDCLSHLRSHQELMMSRLVEALDATGQSEAWHIYLETKGSGKWVVGGHGKGLQGKGSRAHEAVFALWCQVNGVQA